MCYKGICQCVSHQRDGGIPPCAPDFVCQDNSFEPPTCVPRTPDCYHDLDCETQGGGVCRDGRCAGSAVRLHRARLAWWY
jgi:hypothetical protein